MSGIFNSASLGRTSANRFLRPSSSPSSSDQAGALTPSTSHPLGGGPDSSPETTLHPLPYAPRRRTPGGSISSLPGHSSTGIVGAGGAGSSMSSATTTSATTTIPPLFSNPVTPTISTSQLDSTDVVQDAPAAGSVSSPSVATSEGSNGGAIARGSSPAGGGGDTDDVGPGTSSTASTTAGSTSPALSRTTSLKDRLKLTSLKAEAQRGVGLGNDSLGMKMLETLVAKGGERAWEEVKDLVLVKRLTLLLPFATPASSVEVTPEVVREHLVFATGGTSESSGTTPALIVTLSGLVGTMSSDALTFCSFIPADGPIMARLMDPASRSVTLAHLTIPPITFTQQQSPSFPTLTPLLYSAVLPFPPPIPIASSSLFPPSLTSRPRAVSAALPASATRISNPFAGFFGSRAAPAKSTSPEQQPTPPPPTSPSSVEKEIPVVVEPEATEWSSGTTTGTGHPSRRASSATEYIPASSPSSPTSPSATSTDAARATAPSTTDKPRDDVLISAWGVDRPLKRADMEKATGRALREWMTKELEGLPTGIVAAVKRFASFPHPPASQSRSHPSVTPTLSSKSNSKVPAVHTLSTFPPPSTWSDPEVCSSTYQAFFTLVYNDLYAVYAKESHAVEGEDKTAAERREREVEKRALEGVDRVERVLLGLGHNLLFSPPTSNDPKHDAALASRIAALNMLDLSLGHLGVVTTKSDGTLDEEVVQGLDEIVKAVGKEFTKLQAPSCQSPKAQTQVLVRAHQLVIERLRELPAIRLRPEGEPYKPPVAASEASESEDARLPAGIPSPPTVTSPPFSPTKATSTRSEEKAAGGEDGRPTTTTDEERTPRGSTSLELSQAELEEVPALVLEGPAEDGKEEQTTTEASKVHGVESEGEHSVAVGEAMGDSVLLPAKPEKKEMEEEKVAPSSASVRSVASSTGGDREKGGASGADLLLPIIIFSVVKANPFRLVSHLLYIQRYRASMCFSGEASYALVNITAVVEFLENVDPASLGLGGSDKVLAVGELAPIDPDLQRDLSSISAATTGSAAQAAAAQSRLRGKVSAVGELAVSGVNNVVGSGLGALRSLVNTGQALGGAAAEGLLVQLPGGVVGDMGGGAGGAGGATRPGGPARRASAFSIASLTASVAGIGSRERSASGSALLGGSIGSTMMGGGGASASSAGAGSSTSSIASSRTASEWGPRREMVEVSSRPGSIYERDDDSDDDDDDEHDRGMRSSDDDDAGPADTRSLRSVRSVASSRRSSSYMPATNVGNPSAGQERSERMSISERFARLGSGSAGGASTLEAGSPNSSSTSLPKAGFFATVATSSSPILSPPSPTSGSLPLTRGASSQSRRASLLGGGASTFHTPPPATSTSSPHEDVITGPNKRFLECRAGELRIDEVAELLLEYKRLAGVLKDVGVWD